MNKINETLRNSKIISIGTVAVFWFLAISVLYLSQVITPASAATTIISNQAALTYTDSQNAPKTVLSNTVQTTIVSPLAEATFTFSKQGWYLFALAQKPANPYPASVFSGFGGRDFIDGILYRWNNQTGGLLIWDQWSEPEPPEPSGPFGNLDTGMGFWVQITGSNVGKTISYAVAPEAGVKVVDISKKGWAMIGNPFNHAIDAGTNVKFVKAGVAGEKSWAEAFDDNWIELLGYKWDSEAQSVITVGCSEQEPPAWADSRTLNPNDAFWLQIYTDGVSVKFNP